MITPDDVPNSRHPSDDGDLDGHTLDELSDYLDNARLPVDYSIENSPACQIALEALSRLRTASTLLLEREAAAHPEVDESWIDGILSAISIDAHAGRSIPVRQSASSGQIVITEGAIRGLIRVASDAVDGLLLGRCQLFGDITVAESPITVAVDMTILWGENVPDTVARLRVAISEALGTHTELTISGIDVTVHDIYVKAVPLVENPPE